jgi:DNA-binding response OmpR family regulator
MHRKTALVMTKHIEVANKLKHIFADMDVEAFYSTASISTLAESGSSIGYDAIILDAARNELATLGKIEGLLFEEDSTALLLIVNAEDLGAFRMPMRITCDFVCEDARDAEYQARLHQLLWPGEEAGSADFIRMGDLTINLATYQIKIDGEPLDLTYLEYALLAFLITHPGRTYSRDNLLKRVWGFDYYGGSRTVDVHVRRVRAKLGPDYSQYLETVRGVGYLWNM